MSSRRNLSSKRSISNHAIDTKDLKMVRSSLFSTLKPLALSSPFILLHYLTAQLVIIGSGFAGAKIAKYFDTNRFPSLQVTLIDQKVSHRHRYHAYFPPRRTTSKIQRKSCKTSSRQATRLKVRQIRPGFVLSTRNTSGPFVCSSVTC